MVDPQAAKYPDVKIRRFEGTFVTALQEALDGTAISTNSTVDGKYGSRQPRPQCWRLRIRINLDEDGIADPDLLYTCCLKVNPAITADTRRTVKTVPPIYGMTMQYGDKGEPVKATPDAPAGARVFYTGDITGTFNSATRTALKAFQKKMGIDNDGVATPDVQTIL